VTNPAKRKLSAKQILTDIRSGMDASALKRKYGLSDKAFESVCKQLSAAGALTEFERQQLEPPRRSSEPSHKPSVASQWRCPACNTPQAAEVRECPACGVVVAKYVALQDLAGPASEPAPRYMHYAAPSSGTGWSQVVVTIVVLAIIGGAIVLWSTHRAKETPRIAQLDRKAVAVQEDQGNDSEAADTEPSGDNSAGAPAGMLSSDPIVASRQDLPAPVVEPSAPAVEPPGPAAVEPPQETSSTPPASPKYVTGVLRQFSSNDFKKEVVEASKTYPVLFQFYSDT
jgi:hypothetical protein